MTDEERLLLRMMSWMEETRLYWEGLGWPFLCFSRRCLSQRFGAGAWRLLEGVCDEENYKPTHYERGFGVLGGTSYCMTDASRARLAQLREQEADHETTD